MKYKTANINERVETLISHFGLSQRQFAEECGLHQQAISRLINDPNANPGGKMLKNIKSRFPTINANWILFGEGDMVTGVKVGRKIDPVILIPKHAIQDYRSPKFDKEIHFDNFPAYNELDTKARSIQAFAINSRNMEPQIVDGDEVLCRLLPNSAISSLINEVIYIVTPELIGLHRVLDINDKFMTLSSNSPLFENSSVAVDSITEIWLYVEYKSNRKLD